MRLLGDLYIRLLLIWEMAWFGVILASAFIFRQKSLLIIISTTALILLSSFSSYSRETNRAAATALTPFSASEVSIVLSTYPTTKLISVDHQSATVSFLALKKILVDQPNNTTALQDMKIVAAALGMDGVVQELDQLLDKNDPLRRCSFLQQQDSRLAITCR